MTFNKTLELTEEEKRTLLDARNILNTVLHGLEDNEYLIREIPGGKRVEMIEYEELRTVYFAIENLGLRSIPWNIKEKE